MEKKKCILLFSGGMDSTTLLYYLLKQNWEPVLFIINYGSKHNKRENEIAISIAKKLCLDYKFFKIDFSDISKSALTDNSISVPDQNEDNQIQTVVPLRNTMFITMASALAISNNIYEQKGKKKIHHIFITPVLDDFKSYRDCRTKFYKNLEKSLSLGSVYKNQIVKIHTPFIKKAKKQIVEIGLCLRVPYDQTYSCYKGENRPCMVCDACLERQRAFFDNNLPDPTLSEKEWNIFINNMQGGY